MAAATTVLPDPTGWPRTTMTGVACTNVLGGPRAGGLDIANLSLGEVRTLLTLSRIDRLPAVDETVTDHLASVGWLRTHLG